SMVEWAERELNRIEKDDDGMQEMMNKNILDIVKAFSEQGHSNFSATYAIQLIERLLSWKPITPLTGEDNEWNEVGDGMYQNKRCSTVFKKGKDSTTAYDIEGKIFTRDNGETWFTNRDSRVPVIFPYHVPDVPEKVYLDEQEV